MLNDPAEPQTALEAHGFIKLMENMALVAVLATLGIGVTAQVSSHGR